MGFPEEPQSGTDNTPRRSRRDRQPQADSGFFTPAQPSADGSSPSGAFSQAGDAFTPRRQGSSDMFTPGPRSGRQSPRGTSDPATSDPFSSGPPTGPLGARDPLTGPLGGSDPLTGPMDPLTGPLRRIDPLTDPLGAPEPGTGARGGSDPLAGSRGGPDPLTGSRGGPDPLTGPLGGSGPRTGARRGSDPLTGPLGGPDPLTGARSGSDPLTGPLGGPDPLTGARGGSDPLTGSRGGSDPLTGPQPRSDPFAASPRGGSDPFSSGPPTGPLGAADSFASDRQSPSSEPFSAGSASGSDPFAPGPQGGPPGNRKPPHGAPQPPTEAFGTASPQPPGDTPQPDGDQPAKETSRSRRGRAKANKSEKEEKPDKADKPEKTATPRQTWSPYDEGPRSRGPLWASLAGLGVLALLGGGLVVMFNADDPTPVANSTRRTSAPLPTAPPGEFGYAGSRSTDPDPLTVKELFKSKKVTASGRAYEMTVTSKDKKCEDGVLGDKLEKALKSGKCTQLIRASFRDKKGEVIGTVGVANLSSTKNATKVAKAGDKSNYVKPLAGEDEVTKFLGSGSGGAKVWTHGHYAVLVWFQKKDGSEPDKTASKQLFQAAEDVTKATVFKALDVRTLTGSRAA